MGACCSNSSSFSSKAESRLPVESLAELDQPLGPSGGRSPDLYGRAGSAKVNVRSVPPRLNGGRAGPSAPAYEDDALEPGGEESFLGIPSSMSPTAVRPVVPRLRGGRRGKSVNLIVLEVGVLLSTDPSSATNNVACDPARLIVGRSMSVDTRGEVRDGA